MGTRSAVSTMTATFAAVIKNVLDASGTASPQVSLGDTLTFDLASGTIADTADRCFADKGRTITSGNNEDIDIFDFAGADAGAGDANDALGQALEFAEVVTIMAVNDSASVGDLLVGGNGTAAAWNALFNGSDDDAVIKIAPGGFMFIHAGPDGAYPVADVSNHLLRFAASGGNVTYDLYILGRSA